MRNAIVALKGKREDRGQHAGLLLQRYLCENATGEDGNPEEKRAILLAAVSAAANDEVRALYRTAFERWSASLPADPAPVDLQTVGRLIVGLGSENVLETGIRLHHTYGIPILPGSALKGLSAHYCDQAWGMTDEKFKKGKPYHQLLFGTTDDSGCITFQDAWLVPDTPEPLRMDVMTPHHPEWLDGSVAPTDFDSPTPVPFLSVTGRFRVAVAWHGPEHAEAKRWTELALSLLKQALAEWGIGSKTTSGYGRLAEDLELPRQHVVHAASTQHATSQAPATPVKRASGTRTTVRIVGTRDKGFDVQEEGRPQGTLTVGKKPENVEANIGDDVDVDVHNDDSKKPQYRWPSAKPAKKKTDRGKRKR